MSKRKPNKQRTILGLLRLCHEVAWKAVVLRKLGLDDAARGLDEAANALRHAADKLEE